MTHCPQLMNISATLQNPYMRLSVNDRTQLWTKSSDLGNLDLYMYVCDMSSPPSQIILFMQTFFKIRQCISLLIRHELGVTHGTDGQCGNYMPS